MTSKKTRHALVSSIISLVLCCSMLIGTTFAWFTDTVTSENNIIKSGTLNVGLYHGNSKDAITTDASQGTIFNYKYWEPGYTQIKYVKIVNEGNLAFKFLLTILPDATVDTTEVNLADVIDVYMLPVDADVSRAAIAAATPVGTLAELMADADGAAYGILLPTEGSTNVELKEEDKEIAKTGEISYAIVLKMREEAGNEYQGLSVGGEGFDVRLHAIQYTWEKDSFDEQYDANASFSATPGKFDITNNEELVQAFETGGEGTIMNDFGEAYAELAADKEFALNMNGKTLTGTADNYVIVNNGTLSVTGDGTITSNLYGSIENWGSLSVDDLALNVSGSKYGFHCKDGEVVINDISLRAQRGGLNVQGGKVTINGGSITTTSYGTNIGYLVYAASNTSCEVVINGGDFRYEPNYYRHGVLYAGQNAKIVVNDGTFGKGGSNTTKTKWITAANGGTVTIYGGSFEFDPTGFVADGYEAVMGTDGWWTVAKIAG